MENDLPKRERIRLKGFDYNKRRAYFITICTEKRRELLSRIVGGDVLDAPYSVELLPHGKVADRYINQMNEFYNNIKVDRFVIMPDHIHIMLFVLGDDDSSNGESQNSLENGASRTSPPTKQHSIVSRFVSTLKRFCNKEYGEIIWQRYLTITSYVTVKIMRSTYGIFMKIRSDGILITEMNHFGKCNK